jgi:replicative DNA helicase
MSNLDIMNDDGKSSFQSFGTKFQESMVQIMLDDREFSDQMSEVLDINFLELKYLRLFVQKMFGYRNKFGTHPSREIMVSILRSDLGNENEVLQRQTREYFSRVESSVFSRDGEEYIKTTALDFCRRQKLKEAMVKCVGLIQNSSFDEVSKVINDALKLGSNNDVGYDYLLDFERRYEQRARNPISTGWDLLDGIMKGGHGKGELGVVVAPTGAGKSMALVHLGAAALQLGYNVVHYTLELQDTVVAQRYDSCITGIPLVELGSCKDFVLEQVKNVRGKLVVKEYPTRSATINTIKAHLEKLRRSNFRIDMIIVDYGDLIKPVNMRDAKRTELEEIYEDLRGVAQTFGASLWTASQTNRGGLNAEVVTMESISEAFNKCFPADFILSISRTIKDKNTNEGRIFIAKNRNGPDGMIFPIFMDTSNVKIKVLQQSPDTASDLIENAMKSQEQLLKDKYAKLMKAKRE